MQDKRIKTEKENMNCRWATGDPVCAVLTGAASVFTTLPGKLYTLNTHTEL